MSEPSPLEKFIENVLPFDREAELRTLLSGMGIRIELFKRNLTNSIAANPALARYSPGLIYREVSKAAGLGLMLDPQLGEAYLIEAYNYKTRQKEPQLRVGYRGLIKLARQSGEISLIYSHEVHENDYIDCDMGFNKFLIHKPKLFSDRGQIIGYYAVVKFKNGEFDFEPMSVEQVRAIRDRTEAYKAFIEKKISTTPWATDEPEMGKKTCLRRIIKRCQQSPELAAALRFEDQADGYGNFHNGSQPRSIGTRDSTPSNIPTVPPVPVQETAQIESKPIVSTTPVKPIEPVNVPEIPDSSAISDVPSQTLMRETVLEISTQAPLISQGVDRKEPDALELPEMIDAGDDDISIERRYEIFVDALGNCISEEEFNDAWEAIVVPYADDMFPGDYDRFSNVYDKALLRFAQNPPLQNEPSALLLKKAESAANNGRKNLATWLKALSEDDFAKLKPQVKRLYEIADKIK